MHTLIFASHTDSYVVYICYSSAIHVSHICHHDVAASVAPASSLYATRMITVQFNVNDKTFIACKILSTNTSTVIYLHFSFFYLFFFSAHPNTTSCSCRLDGPHNFYFANTVVTVQIAMQIFLFLLKL